ncbi:MAG TPA: hypothetical protein VGR11_12560 [Solirubrobacteraceae bacterium]|nr:hypothetical protein [Solirubrobacteraceae bacterium]
MRAALRPAGRGWQTAHDISHYPAVSEASGAQAAIAVDARGNAIAVWGRELPSPAPLEPNDNVVQAAVHDPP